MTANTGSSVTYRYVRWKAVVFGGLIAALGLLAAWVGIDALNSNWTAAVADGEWLVAAPWWLRGPVMIAMGLFMLKPGLWQLFAAATDAVVVQSDDEAIAARTSLGRLRRLAWRDIAGAKQQQNQIVLSPAGIDTLGQEIWDRKSVILDIGMLDAAPGEIAGVIQHHRPDVTWTTAE